MSNKDVIDDLKKQGLDEYGSWIVYGKDAMDAASNHGTIHAKNMEFPYDLTMDELANEINTQCMCVGSSVAERDSDKKKDKNPKKKSWSNFHDTDKRTKDYNILKILLDSGYIGSYITDIIKFPNDAKDENKDSHNIFTRMKNACENQGDSDDYTTFKFSMEKFQEELNEINPEIIVLFGEPAFNIFKMAVTKNKLKFSKEIKVVKTLHYSKAGQKNIDMYNRFTTGHKTDESEWYTVDEHNNFKPSDIEQ